jgi:hypothetical protein
MTWHKTHSQGTIPAQAMILIRQDTLSIFVSEFALVHAMKLGVLTQSCSALLIVTIIQNE